MPSRNYTPFRIVLRERHRQLFAGNAVVSAGREAKPPVAKLNGDAVLFDREFSGSPCIYRKPGCISMVAGETNADADL